MIFKSKLQIFAAIVWLLVMAVVTVHTYREYNHQEKSAVTAIEGKREILENYFKSVGVTTGLCLLAWGVPFFPGIGYRLASGQPPLEPFDVGKNEKYPLNVNPWVGAFISGSFFIFWVGAIWGEPYYIGGLCAVGLWGVVLISVSSVLRMIRRNKA